MKEKIITIRVYPDEEHQSLVRYGTRSEQANNLRVALLIVLSVALLAMALLFRYMVQNPPSASSETESEAIVEQVEPVAQNQPIALTYTAPEPDYMVYPLPYLDDNLSDPSYEDMIRIAKTVWGEARGCSTEGQAAVIWCIFNRVDDPRWPDTIAEVCVTEQFNGYDYDNPVDPELYELAIDIWYRWQLEKAGETNVGRVLPSEYVFFHGDGENNHFRISYEHDGKYWDWSLQSPYK